MPPTKTAISLAVEPAKKTGALPYWAATWRTGGELVKRRLGPAWLAAVGSVEAKPGGRSFGRHGQWAQRKGRVPDGALDESAARRMAEDLEAGWAQQLESDKRERDRLSKTFRALAHEWQAHMLKIGKHKPSTAYDVACTLVEPGVGFKRRTGESHGLVMRLLGDSPAHQITPGDIEEVFDEYDELERSGRTINKVREQLRAIFNYGADPRHDWGLELNPAALTDRRAVNPSGAIKYFEIEQVEAIAAAAAAGTWRGQALATYRRDPLAAQQDQEENDQLAELIRFAAYTGLRQGELVVLQWSDINFEEQTATVERALSGSTITSPKSGKLRVVPLGTPAIAALKRLCDRPNFRAPDDYVFATLSGDRPDASALRRRYNQARDAAGAPVLMFHGLRHTAASLFIRHMDVAEVKAIMGHASVKTTERYLHARRASDLVDKVTQALTPVASNDEDRFAQQLLSLDADARERVIARLAPKAT
jgi:integrase